MLTLLLDKTTNQWRQALTLCDELTRRGQCGSDLLRLASALRVPLELLLHHITTHHQLLQRYNDQCLEWFTRCETLYRHLYVEAYGIMDKSGGQRQPTVNDGHARQAVPLDPESALNHIQTHDVRVSLPSDNGALAKFPRHSTLALITGINEKIDSLWEHYDREAEALESLLVPPPMDTSIWSMLKEIEKELLLIQSVLLSLMAEQNGDEDIITLYTLCSTLQDQLKLLHTALCEESNNVIPLRDNVLVKFEVSANFLRCVTQTCEVVLSQRPLEHPSLGNIF